MTQVRSGSWLRVGVVGCGYWGPNLVRNFFQVDGVVVTAVCDQDRSRLARMGMFYPSVATETDYERFLDRVDSVVIATPLATHYELAAEALRAGKHVLVEKPFMRDQRQARALMALARKKKLVLMVDHTYIYTTAVRMIKDLIQKDLLGMIHTVSMIRVNLGVFQTDHSVVWDLAYHDMSILLFLFGRLPLSVIAVGIDVFGRGLTDSAFILLKYGKEMVVSVNVSWLAPKKERLVTLVGSKKMVVYDDLAATDKVSIFDRSVHLTKKKLPQPPYYDSFAEFTYQYRSGDVLIPHLTQREPLLRVAEHFVDAVLTGTRVESGGVEGLAVLKALAAIEQSLERGGEEVVVKSR